MINLFQLLHSYPLHRAIVAGLSFGVTIIGARFLPVEQFSALMTAAFLAKFLQIGNLGATAGYFVCRYSGQGPLARDNLYAERQFLGFYLAQMSGVAILVIAIALLWLPEYRLGATIFLLLIPLFVLEPLLRYRRNFSFSLLPEFFLALSLLSALIAYQAGVGPTRLSLVYTVMLGLMGMVMIALTIQRHMNDMRGDGAGIGPYGYAQIIKEGMPVYLGSALFLVASSMDRLLLPLYGNDEEVSIYFLAQQLSIGSMIFVTAINFVNTVDLGEARQDKAQVDPSMVAGKLKSAILVAVASYTALVAGVIILEVSFLPKFFGGLTWVVIFLGAGLTCFFISNAITPIVAYFKRQMPLTISMGFVALALMINNIWVYWNELGIIWLAMGTALTLVAHAGFAVWFTFSVLRCQNKGAHMHGY